MNSFDDLSAKFSQWLDATAGALMALRAGLRAPRKTKLVEEADGAFRLELDAPAATPSEAGSALIRFEAGPQGAREDEPALAAALSGAEVALVLKPDRFLFRPLDLPSRAAEFLEGVVRSQIDRLTPWSAAEAAFGCQPLGPGEGERMRLRIAATSKSALAPFLAAARGFGVAKLSIFAAAPEPGGAPILVLDAPLAGALEAGRLKRVLTFALLGLWMSCALILLASSFVGEALDARRQEAAAESLRLRAALARAGDAASSEAAALRDRKATAPAAVQLYDELARALPDDAYLNELRIQADKIQIAGLAHDPPALIKLIEGSPHFAHATFYAPTTAAPSESAQHFFIEAQVAPAAAPAGEPGAARAAER